MLTASQQQYVKADCRETIWVAYMNFMPRFQELSLGSLEMLYGKISR